MYSWRAYTPRSYSQVHILQRAFGCVTQIKNVPAKNTHAEIKSHQYYANYVLLREEGDDELAKRFVKMPVNLKMIICKVMVNITS